MKKAIHIYAVNGKTNSGDFFLGPATKHRFEKTIKQQISWTNFDVRKAVNEADIQYFNTFDYIVIGGGGLFLPDTNPNNASCWQWACPTPLMEKITTEIHVVGIGWNHFYNQTIAMPHRDKPMEYSERLVIFKNNIEMLLRKCTLFSMRHNGDVECLREHATPDLHDKVKFEFCPVIDYVEEKYSDNFTLGEYHTFEIKDDRPNRRYYKKPRHVFYEELLLFANKLISEGEKIAVMSHDGSSTFISFLRGKGVPFILLNNTVANEEKIIENYSKVKKLYCTAGHSQMMAYALQIPFYSLVTHDKLKYFLEDKNLFQQQNYCLVNDESLIDKLGIK